MDGIAIVVTVSAGLNVFILGTIVLNSYRIGKIEGNMKNGGYISCPFYRKRVNNAAEKSKGK